MNNLTSLVAPLCAEDRRKLLKDLATAIIREGRPNVPKRAVAKRHHRQEVAIKAREMGLRRVYIIGAPGSPLKIGIAAKPTSRLKEIQTGNPVRLKVLFAEYCPRGMERTIEAHCHRLLDHFRLAGEWFDIEIDAAIETVKLAVSEFGGRPDIPVEPLPLRYTRRT